MNIDLSSASSPFANDPVFQQNRLLVPLPPHPAPAATQPPTPSPPPPATADSTPYPLSFAALANLIATGAPIPGIKDIPDKLAEGAPSVSTAQVKKKPWEGVVGAAEERAGGGGPVHNAKVEEEGSGQV